MSWKDHIAANSTVWHGLEEYAAERISDLTKTCTNIKSGDADIRAAQAGILELERLLALPQMVQAEAQMRAQHSGVRKEY
jgi:hypothetical protein